jgi:selenophosphate synthase
MSTTPQLHIQIHVLLRLMSPSAVTSCSELWIAARSPHAGFAITGHVKPENILTKAGLKPGQALILTKPLGTDTCGPQQCFVSCPL